MSVSSAVGKPAFGVRRETNISRQYRPRLDPQDRSEAVVHSPPNAGASSPKKRGTFTPNMDKLLEYFRAAYPHGPAENVAAETDIPLETVKTWFKRRSGLSAGHLLTLANVYGPDVLAAAWPNAPWWLSNAQRQVMRRKLHEEREHLDQAIRDLGGDA